MTSNNEIMDFLKNMAKELNDVKSKVESNTSELSTLKGEVQKTQELAETQRVVPGQGQPRNVAINDLVNSASVELSRNDRAALLKVADLLIKHGNQLPYIKDR